MSYAMRRSARATSVVAATLLILSFGTVGAAFADPGNGNVPDNSQAASNASNGNANGADNGNGSGNGNGNGGSSDDATAAVAAALADTSAENSSAGTAAGGNASSAKSGGGSADKGSSSKGSVSKGSTSQGSSSNGKAGDHQTKGTAGTSGDVGFPQPISGADDNPGGANGQCTAGVYCSTRSGLPSMNGQGKGKAVGKPCAGCVGKADNKNPHGQMPGPSDRNAGYECDRNNGIGKTNPAHTGCKPGTPPDCTVTGTCPPPCVDQPGKPCNPPPPCVPTVANNQCGPPPVCVGAGCNPPPVAQCPEGSTVGPNGECVFGEEVVLCPNGSVMPASGKCNKKKPPTVLGQEAFRPQPNVAVSQPLAGVLPATGAHSGLGLLAGAGFVMLAAGAGAMLRRRTD